MEVTRNILYDISIKQSICYGHIMRMKENRAPKNFYEWPPVVIIKEADRKIKWKHGTLEAVRDRPLTKIQSIFLAIR